MPTLQEIDVSGPFSLAASIGFLTSFGGAMSRDTSPAPDGSARLRLAFPVEGEWTTAGACVRQDGGRVLVEPVGPADPEAVVGQVARILSLDMDGGGFTALGETDRVLGELQRRYAGLRPVNFWSAYEAACWSVIGQRINMRQAARVKGRMAEELGAHVRVDGVDVPAFPTPPRLSSLDGFAGLTDRKVAWLRGLGRAALDGVLDTVWLRSLPRERALAELRRLDGIGPFASELILLRGCGDPDAFATQERRLLDAMRRAYQLPDASEAELAAIADRWRPYRTWAAVLLRAGWEDDARGRAPLPSVS
jgi:DNA-3-methyladenine glycosylase II